MKKIAVLIGAFGTMALNMFGQGQFNFQATSANGLILYSTDLATTAPYPLSPGVPNYGNAHVQFYTAPAGTVLSFNQATGLPDFTGWTANTLVIDIATGVGKTAAKTITVPNAANGVNVEVEAVIWNGPATSWAQTIGNQTATTLLGWSGEFALGHQYGAFGWSQPTGDPTAAIPGVAAGLVTGAGAYGGLILAPIIPEPSVTALTGVGLAAMATVTLIRRRKASRA